VNLVVDSDVVGEWVAERVCSRWRKDTARCIGKLDENGVIVAGVIYDEWTGTNFMCDIAGQGNWASKLFLSIIFDYPFVRAGAKRITARVKSTNEKSIKLVTKMGFKLESRLTQAIPDGDFLFFVMFKEDCKYIRGKYALPQ
jgi:hypothetical protein